jgi:hypothetical protein
MIKVSYNSLSEAFEDYEGFYQDDLEGLPTEVWDALDDFFSGSDLEFGSLSELFDNLYVNDLLIDDEKGLEGNDDVTILYVDDEGTAYAL